MKKSRGKKHKHKVKTPEQVLSPYAEALFSLQSYSPPSLDPKLTGYLGQVLKIDIHEEKFLESEAKGAEILWIKIISCLGTPSPSIQLLEFMTPFSQKMIDITKRLAVFRPQKLTEYYSRLISNLIMLVRPYLSKHYQQAIDLITKIDDLCGENLKIEEITPSIQSAILEEIKAIFADNVIISVKENTIILTRLLRINSFFQRETREIVEIMTLQPEQKVERTNLHEALHLIDLDDFDNPILTKFQEKLVVSSCQDCEIFKKQLMMFFEILKAYNAKLALQSEKNIQLLTIIAEITRKMNHKYNQFRPEIIRPEQELIIYFLILEYLVYVVDIFLTQFKYYTTHHRILQALKKNADFFTRSLLNIFALLKDMNLPQVARLKLLELIYNLCNNQKDLLSKPEGSLLFELLNSTPLFFGEKSESNPLIQSILLLQQGVNSSAQEILSIPTPIPASLDVEEETKSHPAISGIDLFDDHYFPTSVSCLETSTTNSTQSRKALKKKKHKKAKAAVLSCQPQIPPEVPSQEIKENISLKQKLVKYAAENKALDASLKTLQKSATKLRHKIAGLEKKEVEKDTRIKELEEQADKQNLRIKELEKKRVEQKRACQSLETKLSDMTGQLQRSEGQRTALESENGRLNHYKASFFKTSKQMKSQEKAHSAMLGQQLATAQHEKTAAVLAAVAAREAEFKSVLEQTNLAAAAAKEAAVKSILEKTKQDRESDRVAMQKQIQATLGPQALTLWVPTTPVYRGTPATSDNQTSASISIVRQ